MEENSQYDQQQVHIHQTQEVPHNKVSSLADPPKGNCIIDDITNKCSFITVHFHNVDSLHP